jgi:uncharacterized membrane protein YhhN
MRQRSLHWLIAKQCLIVVAVVFGLIAPVCRFHGMPALIAQGIPTTALIVLTVIEPAAESRRYRWGIVLALVFSQISGYLLGRGQFVPGVLGFLAANIAYLTAFTTGVRFAQRVAPFVILGLAGGAVLALAWARIPGSHILPVCLYAATIVSMPAQAIARSFVIRRAGALAAAVGATLLLISDSAIAIDGFYAEFRWAGPFIMTTYFVGQWLIAESVGRTGVAHCR